jgi:hypothetical protein
MIDQLVAQTANDTKHNQRKARTSMHSAGFEPAISADKRLKASRVSIRNQTLACLFIYLLLLYGATNCAFGKRHAK